MRFWPFGRRSRVAAVEPAEEVAKALPPSSVLSPVPYGPLGGGGWFGIIRESFSGAWQRNITIDNDRNILAFSAVYACVTIIASDISKLRLKLVERKKGIWVEVEPERNSPYAAVLRKPNHYQTRIKFIEQYVISKLLHGNTYVLKIRDARNMVRQMFVLDPQRVTPMISDSGEVFYDLRVDNMSGITRQVMVPASEIIHDTMVSLFHPLLGVSPLFACGASATMGNKIQNNSSIFFENMSRPSGILTAPGTISDELAKRMKADWEANFAGGNLGRMAVLGDGLKYEALTIPAQAAQLIEQLKFTVEDVARAFHMPLYKLGAQQPTYNNVGALNQAYYSDCLQTIIESAELCFDEGLELPSGYGTEFELRGLLRMDPVALYEANGKAIRDGWMAPNEARSMVDLPPVKGGETPYMQQQNWALEFLADRELIQDKPSVAPPPEPEPPQPDDPDDEGESAEDEEKEAEAFVRLVDLMLEKSATQYENSPA